MWLVWIALLAGCGRLGFEATGDGALAGDDAPGDGAPADAGPDAPDAMGMELTFGERPSSMVTGVTRDTYISQTDAANNYGGADNLRIERDNGDRGLIVFDLTTLPTTAIVTFAKITFEVEEQGPAPATISAHPVLESWTEGTLDGTSGTANFTFRSGITPWSLLGAAEPASIGPAVATFPVMQLGVATVTLPNSLVQGWVADPGENFGILLSSSSDDTVRFVSSEGAAAVRPMLSITYQ